MKALLLLSVLLLSAGTSKAEGMDPKNAYYFGFVTGAGLILCATVDMGELKKDIAQETLGYVVQELSTTPGSSDVADSIQKAYQVVKQEPECKGVY
jgi:hypothetical protein